MRPSRAVAVIFLADAYSNPKDYNDNEDARKYDARLRGPVRDVELQIDQQTGMKNYIANGEGDWATSAAYVKYSFERSIHYGRLYSNGRGFFQGRDEDLAEALRCLGQGLHTLEDFGAHTNYVELSLRELGFHSVFPHVGTATAINLRGKHVFPLVTGTFGMVDFYHSVLGEATDHFTQSEVNEMDNALGTAQQAAQSSNPLTTLVKLLSKVPGTRDLVEEAEQLQSSSQAQARSLEQQGFGAQGGFRGIDHHGGSSRGVEDWDTTRASHGDVPPQTQGYDANTWTQHDRGYQQPKWSQSLSQPHFQQQWQQQGTPQNFNNPPPQHPNQWQDTSMGQSYDNQDQYPGTQHNWQPQPQPELWQQSEPSIIHLPQPMQQANQAQAPHPTSQSAGPASTALEGMANFDPAKTIKQIYPILAFRDKVVRTVSSIIEKIPGLEALVERITETLTVFVLSLLAPFVRPLINVMSKALQTGSAGVLDSSAQHQFEVWTNPNCSDPTHSMLSKDHFSTYLNEPAGNVAAEILKFIVPRVLYAWEHPDVPVHQVMDDVERIFHHPAIREESNECHRNMFAAVKKWVDGRPDKGRDLEAVLGSDAVRAGKNHKAGINPHPQKPVSGANQPHSTGGTGSFASFLPGEQGSGGHQSSNSSGFSSFANVLLGGQQQNQGGGHGNHPLGAVGDLLGNFTGQHKPAQQQDGGGGGGGGLNSMLGLAEKLPIPGVHGLSKYSKFLGGGFPGGGARALDEQDLSSGGNVGGADELHEAAAHADQYGPLPSPSPMPMQAPPGYEQYGQQEPGSQAYGQEPQSYQHQTAYQEPYHKEGQYGGSGGDNTGYHGGR